MWLIVKEITKSNIFFFSFYKVFAVNPTQIESRVQKNHGIGDQVLPTILGSRGTKMGWNCDSDREKGKYNRKIPTAKSGFLLNTWNNRFLKFRLGKYVTLLKPWLGAFHILRNSGNSGWDCNGTHVFQAFHWKVPGNNWNFKKVVLFSRWKISGEKAWSIYEFSQGITGSSSLFAAISKPPSWILVTKA